MRHLTTRLKRKREPLVTFWHYAQIWRFILAEGFWFIVEMALLMFVMYWVAVGVRGVISPAVTASFEAVGIVRTDLPRPPASR